MTSETSLWVKASDRGSWHLVEDVPGDGIPGMTLCGRKIRLDEPIVSDFAANEKTCESCLRINASMDK